MRQDRFADDGIVGLAAGDSLEIPGASRGEGRRQHQRGAAPGLINAIAGDGIVEEPQQDSALGEGGGDFPTHHGQAVDGGGDLDLIENPLAVDRLAAVLVGALARAEVLGIFSEVIAATRKAEA